MIKPKKQIAQIDGIGLKKHLGQHFLREQKYIDSMIDSVTIDNSSKIFEIGCGDGFLTKSILQTQAQKLLIFEIDPEWAEYVNKTYGCDKLSITNDNFLDINLDQYLINNQWTLLANLPYKITFPIIYKLKEYRHLIKEGVIMVQEEVAQKIIKTHGRGYGFNSLHLQHFFDWKLLDKIPPAAFYPAPKVFSRTLYFKPIENPEIIENEDDFWVFIKRCFSQPRRTLRNTLSSFHYKLEKLDPKILNLRAQQMSKGDLLQIWRILSK